MQEGLGQERDDVKGLAEALAEELMGPNLAVWEAWRNPAAAVGPQLGVHGQTLAASGLAGGERLAAVPPFPAPTAEKGRAGGNTIIGLT